VCLTVSLRFRHSAIIWAHHQPSEQGMIKSCPYRHEHNVHIRCCCKGSEPPAQVDRSPATQSGLHATATSSARHGLASISTQPRDMGVGSESMRWSGPSRCRT